MISETLDYKAIDFLSDFGGYLGLFIGASLLYLYDVFANFFLRLLTTKLGRNEKNALVLKCTELRKIEGGEKKQKKIVRNENENNVDDDDHDEAIVFP